MKSCRVYFLTISVLCVCLCMAGFLLLTATTKAGTNYPPWFQGMVRTSQAVRLEMGGRPGKLFVLEKGSDLNSWQPTDTVSPVSVHFDLTHPDNTNEYAAFLRLQMYPGTNPPRWDMESPLWVTVINTNTVKLYWVQPSDLLDIAGYRVYMDGVLLTNLDAAARSYVVSGLTNARAYVFTVEAGNEDGNWTSNGTRIAINPNPPNPDEIAPLPSDGVATLIPISTRFLYEGDNPVQAGVATGIIELAEVCVLRGRVLDENGMPCFGVVVSAPSNPEYGTTVSRTNGLFDFAVNGGRTVTLRFDKENALPVERTESVPVQDYYLLTDTKFTALDTNVNVLALTNTGMQVARGSVVDDEDGARRGTLLIPGGTGARLILPNGTTQSLETLAVRITEYTVGTNGPSAMPAPLPPTVMYTYAMELSDDSGITEGADTVRFDRTLYYYVTNFIGLSVGTPLPVGYYDKTKRAWVPLPDGVVIRFVAVTNGLAEVDIDGDGLVEDALELAEAGFTDEERNTLVSLYSVGETLWRVPIQHFSPVDINLPGGQGWTIQMIQPSQPPASPEMPVSGPGQTSQGGQGVVEIQNQVFREWIPVVGTPWNLNYSSDRCSGRRSKDELRIPLTGNVISPDLKRVELEVDICGQRTVYSFPPQTNLAHTFSWSRKDGYGRTVYGTQPLKYRIAYLYDGIYGMPLRSGMSFGELPEGGLTGVGQRVEVKLWQEVNTILGGWDARAIGLGGWTLDIHHSYDPNSGTVYLGSGQRKTANSWRIDVIRIVASNLRQPKDIAVRPDGGFYFSSEWDNAVRYVTPEGSVTNFAGTGAWGYSGDGSMATEAALRRPYGLAVAPDGSVYIADMFNHAIRRVGPDGIIQTVAGNGTFGYSGDGGPAPSARLAFPQGVAFTPDGSLYIADTGNHRIRRVSPAGIIQTVAGVGTSGFSGDGGSARNAQLSSPVDVAVGRDGTLYIADSGNLRIRKVTTTGIITTIGGGGSGPGGYDEGIPATNAILSSPSSVAVNDDGTVYFGMLGSPVVRKITPEGLILTVAGNYQWGSSGSGGAARQATLRAIHGLCVAPDRSLYLADRDNWCVWNVYSGFPSFTGEKLAVPSDDGLEVYEFSDSGRHLRTLSTLTAEELYGFGYDAEGRLTHITNRSGLVTYISHDTNGAPQYIQSPWSGRTYLAVDNNGYLSRVENPAGEVSFITNTAEGLVLSITGPRGDTYSYAYDSAGRVAEFRDPGGGRTTLARFDSNDGLWITATSALGVVTKCLVQTRPDESKRLVTVQADASEVTTIACPDGSWTSRAPNGVLITRQDSPDPRYGLMAPYVGMEIVRLPSGLACSSRTVYAVGLQSADNPLSLVAFTNSATRNGRTTVTIYTSADRTFTTITPAGRTRRRVIDGKGRIVLDQEANLAPIQYVYNTYGLLSQVSVGTGAQQRITLRLYDGNGFLATNVNALGIPLVYQNDAAGRVLRHTFADGSHIQYGYDANGNLSAVIPPGRPAHQLSYNMVNLLTEYVPPAVGSVTGKVVYTYDADRRRTSMQRGDGRVVSNSYDSAGRLALITFPGGFVTNTYMAGGQPVRVQNLWCTISMSYDGHLKTNETWSGLVSGSVAWQYDADFRITNITVNGANSVGYSYDADGLLTRAGSMVIGRDPVNGLVTSTVLGGVYDEWSYNPFGEVSRYSVWVLGTNLMEVVYDRDAIGRITGKTETVQGKTVNYAYSYDVRGRIIEVRTNGVLSTRYNYDSNGNITNFTGPFGSLVATYDAQDRLLTAGPLSCQYNDHGEMTNKIVGATNTAYRFDPRGDLEIVMLPPGNPISSVSYLMDGLRRCIARAVNANLREKFLYRDHLSPIAQLDASDNIVAVFVYGLFRNAPDYMVRSGVVYRIISDHLGSPRFVIDVSTGTIAQQIDYDVFGRVVNDTAPGFQPFGFAGGLYDSDTALLRCGLRFYDASLMRWISKDPLLMQNGDPNLYAYNENDPVNTIDPYGLGPVPIKTTGHGGFDPYAEVGRETDMPGAVIDLFGMLPGPAGPMATVANAVIAGQKWNRMDTLSKIQAVGRVANNVLGIIPGGQPISVGITALDYATQAPLEAFMIWYYLNKNDTIGSSVPAGYTPAAPMAGSSYTDRINGQVYQY